MSSFLDNFKEEEIEVKKDSGIKAIENDIENDPKYFKNKKKKLIIEIVVIAFVLMVIGIMIIYFSKVEVPNFDNQLSSIAKKWGDTNKVQIVEVEEYSDDVLEDFVISQSIKPGIRIFKKSVLKIVISKGYDPTEIIKVPDLNSMDGAGIKKWVSDNKLINTVIKEENSIKIEKGKIISYSFSSATVNESNFKREDNLEIIISKGNIEYEKNIEVLNLISKTKDEVSKWCLDNNLICKFNDVINDELESGKVVNQSISSGEVVSKQTEIKMDVSVGKGLIIPSYYGISSENAPAINSKLDIKIKLIYNMDVGYGDLISQSVKAGTRKLDTDNKVELVYSLGKPYFNSLIGTSESELAKTFYEYKEKGVKFTYDVKYVNSDKDKGTVVWSSKSNEFVTMNENIEIHVSNGIKGE